MTATPTRGSTSAFTWSEESTRAALLARSGGQCERCWRETATDAAHRVRAGQGGRWSPANTAHLCRFCHAWAHANPLLARGCGLEVASHVDPEGVPAYLVHEGIVGWWLLTFLGDAVGARSHVLVAVDGPDFGLPEVPEGAL